MKRERPGSKVFMNWNKLTEVSNNTLTPKTKSIFEKACEKYF